MTTATEAMQERIGRDQDERSVHAYMRRFSERWAPRDRGDVADFHADLALVVQAVHKDASRDTHELLMRALAAMPPQPIFIEKK